MAMYDAAGFRVPFPFPPYPLQLHAMGAIRAGLSSGDIVVLESPTGTGKTQVLLNSVLFHLYEPIPIEAPPLPQAQEGDGPLSLAPTVSLSTAGEGRRREGKRVRAMRRRPAVGTDPFLLQQNANEEAREQQQRPQGATHFFDSLSDSSNASSQCNGEGGGDRTDDDDDNEDEEDDVLEPLRKPKIYFSSRTHTQLQQLTEELRRTDFTSHYIRRRSIDALHSEPPRALRYVHVAGRQQLCLNAAIRAASGGSTERLNELCMEAVAYENSRDGRRARKAQRGAPLRDIEDGPGCSYCARERLKLMRDYAAIRPRSLAEMRFLGQRVGGCPFLTTRALLRGADVVLIPYGYLVSAEMRHALLSGAATNAHATAAHEARDDQCRKEKRAVVEKPDPPLAPDFAGDVIVVDEAHNLVDVCRAATAASVTAADLSLMRQLLDGYLARYESRLLTRNKQRIREMVAFLDKLLVYLRRKENETSEAHRDNNNNNNNNNVSGDVEVCALSSFIFDAEIDMVNVYRFTSFLEESRLLPKLHGLVAFLTTREAKAEEGSGTREKMMMKKKERNEKMKNEGAAVEVAWKREGEKVEERESDTLSVLLSHIQQQQHQQHQQQQSVRSVVAAVLHRFDAFLRWYSRSDTHTCVLLRRTSSLSSNGSDATGRSALCISIDLTQLEPGTHTLFPVLRQAAAAVLAGGTMKPLALTCDLILSRHAGRGTENNKTETETEEAKHIRLVEEGHIVPPSSVAVFTLGAGPSGARVELQHATRAHWSKHFDEVAAALLNFSRVVPGGMIVFFTSYEVEELFVAAVQRNGFYDKINEVKRIFREPSSGKRSAAQAHSFMSNNSTNNNSHSSGQGTGVVESMLTDYANCVQQSGGALLLAVMGGKLSEGINFNDDLGRAVIVVGMPYANPSDVELQLHLRHIAVTRLADTPRATQQSGPFDSPAQWGLFTDLCMRSVNQSIGRCIRHAADYAVVILFDPRYGERDDVRRRIAAWMQPSLRVTQSFGECFRGVRDFFVERKNV